MRLKLDIISDKIIDHYTLRDLVDKDRWVYIEICKGMYGLPQAGILANQLLEKRLGQKVYYQCQHTPGLWQQIWRSIIFCLVFNNFGIKVTNKAVMIHLKETLEEHYTVTVDWVGTLSSAVSNSHETTSTATLTHTCPDTSLRHT